MTELSPERLAQLEELRAQLEAEEAADRKATEAEHFRASDLPLIISPALKTLPMGHQVRAMNFAATLFRQGEPGVALLMEQGTGKSLVSIGLATAMAQKGAIDWALVVCPNSLKGTWAARDGEIQKHSALPADITVLRGSKQARIDAFRRALGRRRKLFQWVVTNIDQFSSNTFRRSANAWNPTESFQSVLDLAERYGRRGLLILDESSKVKNPEAKRTQAVQRLAALFAWRMILTGTPVTKSPLDVWAQFEVLKRGALGIFSYLGFERHYGIQRSVRRGRRMVVETVAYRNLDELEERVSRLSFRALAKDCLDLPEVVERVIPVELSPEQEVAHQQLRTDMLAELESGDLIDGRNILTRLLRMAQIVGGSVGTMDQDGQPTGEQHRFDPNPKLDALAEYLDLAFEDETSKAVVFCQFRAEIAMVEELCKQRGWEPAIFHGDVTEEARDEERQRFHGDPRCRVFIAQYQTGSFGLNLVAANHLIFFGITPDWELTAQAQKRVHRKGQERLVNQVTLKAVTAGGRETIDRFNLNLLEMKQGYADIVTGDRKELVDALSAL